MSIGQRSGWMLLALVAVMIAAAPCVAADRVRAARPTGENVELFAAIKSGQIEVQANPTKDESELTVRILNKTDKPLSVKLPEAFAARQILAQMGGRGGGMGGMGGMGGGMGGMGGGMGGMGGGGGQSMGGGMGGGGMMGGMGGGGMGMGGGMGGMGMGMGMMNVAPEKVAKFRVTTVCLEHGKPTPRSGMKYQIVPVEQVSSKPAVEEVCRMLGTGKVSQRAVQAAVWHLNSNMSWEQLARKEIKSVSGNRPYFTADEIHAAMQLAAVAVNTVEQKKKATPTEPKKYSAGQTVSQN